MRRSDRGIFEKVRLETLGHWDFGDMARGVITQADLEGQYEIDADRRAGERQVGRAAIFRKRTQSR